MVSEPDLRIARIKNSKTIKTKRAKGREENYYYKYSAAQHVTSDVAITQQEQLHVYDSRTVFEGN